MIKSLRSYAKERNVTDQVKFLQYQSIAHKILLILSIPCVQKRVITAKPLLRLTYSFWKFRISSAWKHMIYHLFIQNFLGLAQAVELPYSFEWKCGYIMKAEILTCTYVLLTYIASLVLGKSISRCIPESRDYAFWNGGNKRAPGYVWWSSRAVEWSPSNKRCTLSSQQFAAAIRLSLERPIRHSCWNWWADVRRSQVKTNTVEHR